MKSYKKTRMFIAIILILSCFAQSIIAQGTLYVSNLGQSSTGGAVIGGDAWIAQSFITGTNSGGYDLNSIQLLVGAASGSPTGFSVSIFSSLGNGAPGGSLGSLNGSDPAASSAYTYTTSGIMLSPSSSYYVVATAATPVAQGDYAWSLAGNDT
jgi:hypothetical protein